MTPSVEAMIPPFEVLSETQPLHRHYLLEASAGTGKTFAIENLVARLLLGTPVVRLNEILVVTFTRAATRELRARIFNKIQETLTLLHHDVPEGAPAYLQSLWREGPQALHEARRRLEEALMLCDDAQIFTIHGFCARMLSEYGFDGDVALSSTKMDMRPSRTRLCGAVKDVFRTAVTSERYSARQIELVLSRHRHDVDTLVEAVCDILSKGLPIAPMPNIDDALVILARLAHDSAQHLQNVQREEELLSSQDLLTAMRDSLEQEPFAHKVRSRYQAAIIDEFQDTDEVQWTIFRRLFLMQEQGPPYLYLVGDPKQSIYAFRGADLYTYLEASKAMGADHIATLDTNYRSQPALVEALNVFFGTCPTDQYMPLPRLRMSLPYRPVKAGRVPEPLSNPHGRGSMHFFVAKGVKGRSKSWPPKAMESDYLFPFIASELARLHQESEVPFSECAILVRDRHQSDRLVSFLSSRNIPTITRRTTSLATSPVVEEVRAIMKAIMHPRDHSAVGAALGTRLIGWTHRQIQEFHEAITQDPFAAQKVVGKFLRLRQRLLADGIAGTLQDVMLSTWHDDQRSVEERILSQHGGGDVYADFYHLSELLVDYQGTTGTTLEGLLTFFNELVTWDFDNDERLMIRRDASVNAVQVLTMHISKGLEFGYVFALGVASRTIMKEGLIPGDFHGERMLVVSSEAGDMQESYLQEVDAEKMRQLYVALTRAKHRLYVPVAMEEGHKGCAIGTSAPLELFLNNVGALEDPLAYFDRLGSQADITYSILEKGEHSLQSTFEGKIPAVMPPPSIKVPGRGRRLYSYSSLVRGLEHSHSASFQSLSSDRTPHTLPAGSDTGNMLHLMMEALPFSVAQQARGAQDICTWFDSQKGFRWDASFVEWKDVLCEMAFNALRTPLMADDPSFCLSQVSDSACYREMEFLYPCSRMIVEDMEYSSGLLKGFVDLFFRYKDKYYLVDWKSNWLGGSTECYSQDRLKSAMQEHRYFLQADIYASALQKYLRLVDDRPFQECFGGAFYLFVRGMSTHTTHGIYHYAPKGAIE